MNVMYNNSVGLILIPVLLVNLNMVICTCRSCFLANIPALFFESYSYTVYCIFYVRVILLYHCAAYSIIIQHLNTIK